MRAIRDPIVSSVALLAVAMLAAPRVLAAPAFTVNSILDEIDDSPGNGTCHTASNTCTLGAAVMEANKSSGAGATIMLPAGTYTLTIPTSITDSDDSGDLNLTAPANGSPLISIVGAGASRTIIDANQLDRVLSVHARRTAAISGVDLSNGFATDGGGIYNNGTLTIHDSTIELNQADNGGGIYNIGTLTVTDSTIGQNIATTTGGGASTTWAR